MTISSIATPIYQPARRTIESISNASAAVVVTTQDHNYRDGDIVRMVIPVIPFQPLGFGMPEINNKTGTVTVIDDTSFSINIDSTLFEPFIDYDQYAQVSQVVHVGEVNSTIYGATQNTLPSLVRPYSP